MGLAYMLTPKYAADSFYFDEDQIDIIGYVEQFATRIDPNTAELVRCEMIAFVTAMSTLSQQRKEIIFKLTVREYWHMYGRGKFPNLFKIAQPIIEMICSSATSERTWSTFKFINSRLRNRLSNEKVKKLVFLYTNSALLDEKDKNDYIMEDGAVLNGNECEEL